MNMTDLVKLAAEALAEDRWWDFADRLADEAGPVRSPGDSGDRKYHDGSGEALADLSVKIEKETGHRFSLAQLREIRSTALAWPPGERDHDVEFEVHRRLRSPKAKGQLAMYKRRAEADYKRSPGYQGSPRLTSHRLRIYKKDGQPVTPADLVMAAAAKRVANKALSLEELDAWERAFNLAFRERRKTLGGS